MNRNIDKMPFFKVDLGTMGCSLISPYPPVLNKNHTYK